MIPINKEMLAMLNLEPDKDYSLYQIGASLAFWYPEASLMTVYAVILAAAARGLLSHSYAYLWSDLHQNYQRIDFYRLPND